jgi:hypothetical protein
VTAARASQTDRLSFPCGEAAERGNYLAVRQIPRGAKDHEIHARFHTLNARSRPKRERHATGEWRILTSPTLPGSFPPFA